MATTPNYGLILPGENDFYDINVTNSNNTKIDTVIKQEVDAAKSYTDQKVADIDLTKITPESIGAAKKSDLDTHIQDNAMHITAGERNTWNAKETQEGAQAKANTAETNAKNASLPRTGGTISGDLAVTNSLTVASRNIIWEIDNLKQSGADAKNRIAGAVSAKGVPASAADDFPTLAWKIGQIVTGVPFARINTNVSENFQSFKPYEDATVSSGLSYVMVTGLSFTAKGIIVLDKRGK
ncbi:phage tail protein, partial [Paenibacillus alvei]|nr:phage tail protein [Paenibacillus alvei]